MHLRSLRLVLNQFDQFITKHHFAGRYRDITTWLERQRIFTNRNRMGFVRKGLALVLPIIL